MTAKEAIAILENATKGNEQCGIAIEVIKREIAGWRDEVEKLEVTLERVAKKLIDNGLM